MTQAFVSVGSNIHPAQNVGKAIDLLARRVRVVGISTVYRTRALGLRGQPGQPEYFNCVAQIETDLPPAELKHSVLRGIEDQLGRRRTADQYAPRTIDLDLIVYADVWLRTADLSLPDPDIARRSFLAMALRELAPDLTLPGPAGPGVSVAELAAALPHDGVEPAPEYTETLRKRVLGGDSGQLPQRPGASGG